jgi:hypothetical protein
MRAEEGSQAVVALFLWDLANDQLHVFQVGDVAVTAHLTDGTKRSLAANQRGRLSSASNTEPFLEYNGPMEGVVQLMVKSDGVPAEWGEDADGHGPADFEPALDEWAAKDDVSFISVKLRPAEQGQEIGNHTQFQAAREPSLHAGSILLGLVLGVVVSAMTAWALLHQPAALNRTTKPTASPVDAKVMDLKTATATPTHLSAVGMSKEEFMRQHAIFFTWGFGRPTYCLWVKANSGVPAQVSVSSANRASVFPDPKAPGSFFVFGEAGTQGALPNISIDRSLGQGSPEIREVQLPVAAKATRETQFFEIDVKEVQ